MLVSNFQSEPQLREKIKAVVVEDLIQRHVKDRITVTDEDVRVFYDENTSAIRGEEVRASHILLTTRGECEALAPTIRSDAEFQAAAKEHSLHRESATRGGDLGLFMNHAGPLGFETSLFSMQPGDMRIFDSTEGCHLVRITRRETPPLPPLDNVAAQIRTLLEAQREQRLLRELLERAQQGVKVERPAPKP